MIELLQIIAAFYLADFVSAVFHLVTDRGWGLPVVVAWFRKHHAAPQTMTFDLMPAVAGVPLFIVGLLFMPWLLCPFGFFLTFAQIPHYYTHHSAPPAVRWLQRYGIFLRPEKHMGHHGNFDRDFAVLNGASNPLVNWLAGIVPERGRA